MDTIKKELFKLSDNEYKEFNSALLPTVNKNTILGVRTPLLRAYAKSLYKKGGYEAFLKQLPHTYYEENNLHAFLVEQIKDFDNAVSMTEEFLPYIDNWATCDMFSPKVFKKNKTLLYEHIKKWIKSGKVYTVRYAIKLLMSLYLDEDFSEEHLYLCASCCGDEYYINMVISWYFATALFKQEKNTLPLIEKRVLSTWVHNKTIQKAKESKRISPEMKEYLNTLKIN